MLLKMFTNKKKVRHNTLLFTAVLLLFCMFWLLPKIFPFVAAYSWGIEGAGFSSDGNSLIICAKKSEEAYYRHYNVVSDHLLYWDFRDYDIVRDINLADKYLWWLQRCLISRDGEKIAFTAEDPSDYFSTQIISMNNKGDEIGTFRAIVDPDDLYLLAISSDGNMMASTNEKLNPGPIIVWNLSTQQQKYVMDWQGDWIFNDSEYNIPGWIGKFNVKFSPDNRYLATVEQNQQVWMRDVYNDSPPVKIAEGVPATALGFSPDGHMLAIGSWVKGDTTSQLVFWDRKINKILNRIPINGGQIGELEFSPDGKKLAVCPSSGYNGVVLINLETGSSSTLFENLYENKYAPAYNLLFSPDGKNLLLMEHQTVNSAAVYNLETGKAVSVELGGRTMSMKNGFWIVEFLLLFMFVRCLMRIDLLERKLGKW